MLESTEIKPRLAASGKPRLEAKSIDLIPEAYLSSEPHVQPAPSRSLQEKAPEIAYAEPHSPTKYSIKKGDSLWTIAKRHGVLLEDLLSYNGLQKDSVLKIGQDLLIPSVKSPLPSQNTTLAPQETESYIVQRGDTLSALSLAAKITVAELKSLNSLSKDILYVGQKLSLPKGTQERLKSLKATAREEQPKLDGLWPDSIYIVNPGDTLSKIAYTQKISTQVLMELNGIQDPKSLRAGQKLKLPNEAKAKQAPALSESKMNLDTGSAPSSVLETTDKLLPPSPMPDQPAPPIISNKEEDETIFDDLTEAPVISLEEVKS